MVPINIKASSLSPPLLSPVSTTASFIKDYSPVSVTTDEGTSPVYFRDDEDTYLPETEENMDESVNEKISHNPLLIPKQHRVIEQKELYVSLLQERYVFDTFNLKNIY